MNDQPSCESETKPDASEEDPAIARFLALLEKDILENPHRLVPLTQELMDEVNELVSGVEVDLDAPLDSD